MGCGASKSTDASAASGGGGGGIQKVGVTSPELKGVPQREKRSISIAEIKKGSMPVLPRAKSGIMDDYSLNEKLGKGSFGVTYVSISKKDKSKSACKVINKRKLTNTEDVEDVQREVEILHAVEGHRNVVPLIAAYEDKENIYILQELCSGGELYEWIQRNRHYSEKIAASLVRVMLSCLVHIHSMGVVHRDLKPENFMFATRAATPDQLKLIDFGLSAFCKPGEILTDPVGTPYFTAPEVFRSKYSHSADTWSIGVMLYVMLSGEYPYVAHSVRSIRKKICLEDPEFKGPIWDKVSADAKAFICKILVKKNRPSPMELLKDPWVKPEGGTAKDEEIEPTVTSRLNQFAKLDKLQKLAAQSMVANMPIDALAGMTELFQSFDKDSSGHISINELRVGLKKMHLQVGAKQKTEEELDAIIKDLDVDGNGQISYEEFVAATIHLAKLETDDRIYEVFKQFDHDQSGFITKEELLKIGEVQKIDLASDVDEFIRLSDTDGDGKISYEEFTAHMKKLRYKELYGVHVVKGQERLYGKREGEKLVVKKGEALEPEILNAG
jgi:calcium-dependent protein kinase